MIKILCAASLLIWTAMPIFAAVPNPKDALTIEREQSKFHEMRKPRWEYVKRLDERDRQGEKGYLKEMQQRDEEFHQRWKATQQRLRSKGQ